MTYLNKLADLELILISIYCFVDDFIKNILLNIKYALQRPDRNNPPVKKFNLGLAELTSLALFKFFTGHRNWKTFYYFVKTYHQTDFPNLPSYQNFLRAMNKLSFFALFLLQAFMSFFRKITGLKKIKITDSTKLEVCKIKREFSHKVVRGLAAKSKSTMGWFYGFKLHIICNELMQILSFRITAGNIDDRKGLDMIWNNIFGLIIADAGYLGKNWQEKAKNLGKQLFTAVKANMKKIMTKTQHQLLKLRQRVETIFSVLKLRLGLETSLPRSPLGYFAHYIWCLTAYQINQYFTYIFTRKEELLSEAKGMLA